MMMMRAPVSKQLQAKDLTKEERVSNLPVPLGPRTTPSPLNSTGWPGSKLEMGTATLLAMIGLKLATRTMWLVSHTPTILYSTWRRFIWGFVVDMKFAFASALVGNTHEGGTRRWKFARGCDAERLILTKLASLAKIKRYFKTNVLKCK
jgi:hypothetical protein